MFGLILAIVIIAVVIIIIICIGALRAEEPEIESKTKALEEQEENIQKLKKQIEEELKLMIKSHGPIICCYIETKNILYQEDLYDNGHYFGRHFILTNNKHHLYEDFERIKYELNDELGLYRDMMGNICSLKIKEINIVFDQNIITICKYTSCLLEDVLFLTIQFQDGTISRLI